MSQIIIVPIIAATALVCAIYRAPVETPAHRTYVDESIKYVQPTKNGSSPIGSGMGIRGSIRHTSKQVCIYIQSLGEESCTSIQVHAN